MVFSLYNLVEAIWVVLPAYASNGLVPLVGKKRRLHPLDFGKTWKGKPLLGKNKSWEGLIFGSFIGTLIASIQAWAYPFLPFSLSPVSLRIVPMSPFLGFLLGFGAMLGDAGESFLKRRLGIKPGKPLPVLDQIDFLFGAIGVSSFLISWKWEWVVLLVIITPVFHFLANLVGYVLGVKKEPW